MAGLSVGDVVEEFEGDVVRLSVRDLVGHFVGDFVRHAV